MSSQQDISFPRALSMYVLTSVFLFFEMALQVSPSVMSSQLMQSLNMTAFGLGIMSGCYFYTYAFMQLPSGMLFDRFNPKFIIIASILICTLGNFLLSISSDMLLASLARLLMGMGSAFAFVSVLVVTKDLFPGRLFPLMTGITQALAAIGAMSGQLPISLLVQSVGWRHTLMLLSGFGILLVIAISILFGYKAHAHRAASEVNHRDRLFTIFKNPQTWLVALYAMLMWAPMSGFTSLWGVPYLESVYHLTSTKAAFICSLMWMGLAIGSPLLGYLSAAFNNRKWLLIIASTVGTVAFSSIIFGALSLWWLAFMLLLAGAACAGQALTFTVVKENNSTDVAATAISLNNMAVVISGALFQPLMGWVVTHTSMSHTHNLKEAVMLVFGAYVLSLLVSLLGIRESSHNT